MKKTEFIIVFALLAVLAAPAALFAGGGAEAGSGGADAVRQLLVWTTEDQERFIDPVLGPVARAIEADNPGTEVIIEPKPLDDIKLTLKLALTSDDSPDVTQVNQGVGELGLYAESGLLMDLTGYAEQMGWFDRMSRATLKGANYPAEGIYGVSTHMELVGCFYNKEIFDEADVDIPETFAEFEEALAAIKAAGYTPLNFGNLDGWPAIHYYGAVQHVMVGRDELDGMMTGAAGSSWDVPGNRDAAAVMQEWTDKGYFTDNFSGIGYDDSLVVFNQGETAIWLTGNWMSPDLEKSPFDVGFFILPSDDPATLKAIGGASIPYAVSANTDEPELAKAFVDALTYPEFGDSLIAGSMIPAMKAHASVSTGSSLFADLLAGNDTVREANGLGWYLDWATPTFYDTITGALQQLFAGTISPETFTDTLQKDYAQY